MQKVFSFLYNNHPLYKKCLSIRPINNSIDHEIITERVLTNGSRSFALDTDIERIAYLQKHPDAWYLDADVVVKKWPDFEMEKGFPYISYDRIQYDLWCILGNGCQWFFDYLMDYYYKCNEDPEPLWIHSLINSKLCDRIKRVSDGYFEHLLLRSIDFSEKELQDIDNMATKRNLF